jgi:colicin import membrane protein
MHSPHGSAPKPTLKGPSLMDIMEAAKKYLPKADDKNGDKKEARARKQLIARLINAFIKFAFTGNSKAFEKDVSRAFAKFNKATGRDEPSAFEKIFKAATAKQRTQPDPGKGKSSGPEQEKARQESFKENFSRAESTPDKDGVTPKARAAADKLGVDQSKLSGNSDDLRAAADEARSAAKKEYMKAARENHPDKQRDMSDAEKEAATERFREAQEQWDAQQDAHRELMAQADRMQAREEAEASKDAEHAARPEPSHGSKDEEEAKMERGEKPQGSMQEEEGDEHDLSASHDAGDQKDAPLALEDAPSTDPSQRDDTRALAEAQQDSSGKMEHSKGMDGPSTSSAPSMGSSAAAAA